jgi:hypothetical protein
VSRYMLNKFLRSVEMSDAAVAAYVADPDGFLRSWLDGAAGRDARPDDRELTAEEARAFSERDFAALYVLGAHPYLLWHFTEAVYIHETTWPELNERYRAAVRPHGYPDAIV